MTKYICTNSKCKHRNCMLDVEDGVIVEDAVCQVRGVFLSTQWKVCDKLPDNWYNTQKNELPKLTAEVFDRPDCPEWAEYAAVDKNGYVFVFDLEPECTHSSWYKRTRFGSRYELCNGYDSSDYEHSLVRRSEQKQESVTDCNQLPDWCKNGALAWENGDYFELEVIDEDHQITMKYSDGTEESVIADYIGKHVKQARLRPYNAEEMKALVGKVLDRNGDRGLVSFYDGDINKVYLGSWFSADDIMGKYTIDGAPCGKFEHLNDAGEWEA